jgi:HAD superfamily hydrolase (TIGR01484 family)
MRYLILACDYDGTLATHGQVDRDTLAALERLLASGRKLVLVTGRELPDLQKTFPHLDLFAWVVAENGALLYRPATREEKPLAEPPPERFLQALSRRGVQPVSVGHAIVATWEPHERHVLEAIQELGLELQVIFNKGAVMVLPSGVNKATGLAAALKEMELSPHNVVGVGDAENDHAFLCFCECAGAVANALPIVKETADFTTNRNHGAGVAELIDEMIADDLRGRDDRLTRHRILLGTRAQFPSPPAGGEGRVRGAEVHINPYGLNILIAGPSGSGKSTVATGLLERLAEKKYQFCIIDPEGDYETFDRAVALGTSQRAPGVDEVLHVLKNPEENCVVNLVGMPVTERPMLFLTLLPRLQELRAKAGRPHWLVIDEAHHLLPASWEPAAKALPGQLGPLALITVHPNQVAPAILSAIDVLVAVGQTPEETLLQFCAARGDKPPAGLPSSLGGEGRVRGEAIELQPGEVLVWWPAIERQPFRLQVAPSHTERRRHIRKYAEGELPPDRSFYFRGPEGKLNLRAQNLILFLQLADGVDDDTWSHHLRQGDYSRWFREKIKDEALAAEVARVEKLTGVSPKESRALIRAAVQQHYTLPAEATLPMPGTDAAGKHA